MGNFSYQVNNFMIYITQLIYIHEGKGGVLDQFEAVAIPLIYKYKGILVFRCRPAKEAFIESKDQPYEIHLVSFPSEDEFEAFKKDEERKQFLHLKEEAIKAVLMIKGNALG
jgi:uncharacterized protein (DUF1330 family)